ncbi:class A beta-lactamase [Coriobacteriaceae bacterium BV3Ac1]|nr:class A beta-lactamase [Coriobacteriaceae bacterium BV3Ac1]
MRRLRLALLATALAGIGVLVVATLQGTHIREKAVPIASTLLDSTGSSTYSTSAITTENAANAPDTEAGDEIEPFATTASLLPLFFDEHNQSYLQNPHAAALLRSEAMGNLADEISLLEKDGYSVGVVLLDIQTERQLTYHADEVFYPASSIKGPYITSLYQQLVETGQVRESALATTASNVLRYSDNTSYAQLRLRYGSEPFEAWLAAAGIDAGAYDTLADYATPSYPNTTPRQLLGMWQQIYRYLEQDSDAANALEYAMSQREVSALDDALEGPELSWSKAGWYPADAGDNYCATVDAGIVWSDQGPYIAVVMSDVPDDMAALVPIFTALDEIHATFATTTASAIVPSTASN